MKRSGFTLMEMLVALA
ncbi:MAG: prepilin-type N-terminal cleavage/methylation domain-containing protein, partial [Gammaproteobacteria bacterium]|nr:prepilin-type N-terminal cleavage/methylation domain-containing protein [Gammaproteobacteria bacterium]